MIVEARLNEIEERAKKASETMWSRNLAGLLVQARGQLDTRRYLYGAVADALLVEFAGLLDNRSDVPWLVGRVRALERVAEAARALDPHGWKGSVLTPKARERFSRLAAALDAVPPAAPEEET